MNFTKIRNDLSVYVVDSDQSSGDLATEALRGVGYHVEVFRKGEDVLAEIAKHPPHIILTGTYLMGMTGLQLLKQVKGLSPDIHVIFMANYAESAIALEASQAGAFDRIFKPVQAIQEIIATVDRLAEKMFMEASNEELYAKLMGSRESQKRLRQRFKFEREFFYEIQKLVPHLSQAKDLHEIINRFVSTTHHTFLNTPVAFFRYLSAQEQFVLAEAVGVENQNLKGVQLGLSASQIEQDPDALNDSVMALFDRDGYEFRFVKEEGRVIGLFLFLKAFNDPFERKALSHLFDIFQMGYQQHIYKKLLHENLIHDEVTGLFNKAHFQIRLGEEIRRARRITLPVSLIHIGIDSASKLKESLSTPEWNQLVRHMAQSLKKASRVNDIAARFSDHELVLILPHTGRIGAAIKAEKFRRFVERTQFLTHRELAVTVTIGVSEYPTLSIDADNLALSADAAYFQVKKIGNKVCMAAAPRGIEPDFEVPTELEE
jgi:diguanylate cyclase (GGDEF)-like protein